jgi:hypothetical protein
MMTIATGTGKGTSRYGIITMVIKKAHCAIEKPIAFILFELLRDIHRGPCLSKIPKTPVGRVTAKNPIVPCRSILHNIQPGVRVPTNSFRLIAHATSKSMYEEGYTCTDRIYLAFYGYMILLNLEVCIFTPMCTGQCPPQLQR